MSRNRHSDWMSHDDDRRHHRSMDRMYHGGRSTGHYEGDIWVTNNGNLEPAPEHDRRSEGQIRSTAHRDRSEAAHEGWVKKDMRLRGQEHYGGKGYRDPKNPDVYVTDRGNRITYDEHERRSEGAQEGWKHHVHDSYGGRSRGDYYDSSRRIWRTPENFLISSEEHMNREKGAKKGWETSDERGEPRNRVPKSVRSKAAKEGWEKKTERLSKEIKKPTKKTEKSSSTGSKSKKEPTKKKTSKKESMGGRSSSGSKSTRTSRSKSRKD